MILGNGMLAYYFSKLDREDTTFFCSGVADSSTNDEREFLREINLLLSIRPENRLVYTSTLSAILNKTPYQRHKLDMEALVRQFPRHLILRVGNLVGKNQNQGQFFPSMIKQVQKGRTQIRRCQRDLLAVTDYVNIVGELIEVNGTIRLCASNPPWVLDVVHEIERHLGIQCVKEMIDTNEPSVFEADILTGPVDYYIDVIDRYFL